MLLAIDVGNTNVTIGVFEGERLVHHWRLAALRERTADELGIFVTRLFEQTNVAAASVSGIAVASVVPPLTRPMEEMCERYFGRGALLVDATNAGIPIRYSPAADVGADRIVNAVAALEKYGKGKNTPLIVVDFGTATTFDVISREGEYVGGVICPGINISAEALFSGPPGCRASTFGGRHRSSDRRRSMRCSRVCSSATWRWSTGWCSAFAARSLAATRPS